MEEYDLILERRDDHTAQLVKQYRGWQKAKSASYQSYLTLVSPDGRVRPNYKMHGTKTGRLSCEKPNLQQIPKVSKDPWNAHTKKSFIEIPGYTLWEADYSQLELRLATAYANEESLIQTFNEDRDIFSEMAARLSMVRQDVKTMVYSIQYGAGINRLKNVFGWTDEQAYAQKNNYQVSYPRIHGISEQAKYHAKAINSVIQGGAADIVEGSMHRLFDEVDDGITCRMLLQVHDSVVFSIRDDVAETVIPHIKTIMEDVEHGKWGVKFAVDVHKWGE
jgi:DNA polymerase-1